jgi:hypothetical protein
LDVAGGDIDREHAAHMVLIYFPFISESTFRVTGLCIQAAADHDVLAGVLLRCF